MKKVILAVLAAIPLAAFSQNEFNLDKTYSIDRDGTIELTSDDAKVSITGSDRSDVHISIYRKVESKGISSGTEKFDVEITESNGNLYIREKSYENNRIVMVGYKKETYTINIEVPEGVGLSVRGDDDDYWIKNVHGDIDMRVDDGDIYLSNCRSKFLKFDVDDGDIEIDEGRGDLFAQLDDGDINVKQGRFDNVSVRLDDGTVTMKSSLPASGEFNFKLDDATLDLTVTEGGGQIEIRHDDSRITSSGQFEIVKKDDNYRLLQLAGGEARVNIRADDGRIRLTKY